VKKLLLSAVLLAGGNSKRMGRNKAFLKLEGRKLLDIVFEKMQSLFSEVIVVTDCLEEFKYLPAKLTMDLFNEGEKSALRGIHAGLTASSYPSSFIIGCDMPFLSLPLIRYMSRFATQFDVVVPRERGYYQPLFAFYKKETLDIILDRLQKNKLKITDLYSSLKIKEVDEETVKFFDPCLLSFFNINTKEDYFHIQNNHLFKRASFNN
jgi:molybdenum cofactor guanylyltransferase